MKFPCTSCGQCCRKLNLALETDYNNVVLNEIRDNFPYKTLKDGSCEMLTEDGLCSVYETRPIFCNVAKSALLAGFTDLNAFYRTAAEYCNNIIREGGLDESYLVKF